MIRQEGIDLLAQEAGVGEKSGRDYSTSNEWELDFAASLEARVALLKGLETSIFPKIWSRWKSHRVLSLITELHQRVTRLALFRRIHEVIDPIARSLGIDLVRANRLQVSDGHLTGEVLGEI